MARIIRPLVDRFLSKNLDFRVRLFNVLAMAGIAASLISTASCVINQESVASTLSNLAMGFIAYGLMHYACASGKYQLCYMITIVAIFFVGFSIIFFLGGGYYGAMPFFFIFAVVFTVYMLEGRKAIAMAALELLFYTGLCLFSYAHPWTVTGNDLAYFRLVEVLMGFLSVSVMLGITMFLQFKMYNHQQRELEAAREEALCLSESKSRFLTNMSHEIRTPINVMLGMNEMILRESDSAQVKSYGTNIQRAGRTLMLLINNVLDVSKIESGKLAVLKECYEIADLVEELSMTGTEQANRYGLSFQTVVDDTIPSALMGDVIHIKQIVVNFLSNAAKYTKEGGITLSFAQKTGKNANEIRLCIAVADTGIGIREENLSIVFDAFLRADMPSNRYTEGTGLGLAITKELAALMGGQVFVESQWGVGSTFSVEIPQTIHDKRPIGTDYAAKVGCAAPVHFIAPGAAILVVDDNKENLQIMRSLLSRTMMKVDVAQNGAQCIEAVHGMRYDVIVMDYMMPDMDGIETLQRLKALPGFDSPVIAHTANVVVGVREKLLQAGFCAYLSKPVMWDDFEKTLLAILPESALTLHAAPIEGSISPAEKEKLSKELLDYGITLEDGLHYLSGDILQYQKVSSFFVDSYAQGKAEIEVLAAKSDWERMKFCVHSLKSKAKAVGANSLSATAAKLEALCGAKDGAYIAVILVVLVFEWNRARAGLSAFGSQLASLLPKPKTTESRPHEPEVEIAELRKLLRHNRQPDALQLLDTIIDVSNTSEMRNALQRVRQCVDAVEFREAERMLDTIDRTDLRNVPTDDHGPTPVNGASTRG